MDPRTLMTYAAGAALVLAVAAAGTQTVLLANERAAHADTRTTHATTLQGIADATTRSATAAQRAQQAMQQAVAAIDAKHTQELSHALSDNDRLRADVFAGRRRLRIAAVCPAPDRTDLPSGPSAPGLADGATVELSPEAGQAVLDLRADLTRDRAKLAGLQEYVRAIRAKESDALPNP